MSEGGADVAGGRGVDEAGLGVGAEAAGPGVQPRGGRGAQRGGQRGGADREAEAEHAGRGQVVDGAEGGHVAGLDT